MLGMLKEFLCKKSKCLILQWQIRHFDFVAQNSSIIGKLRSETNRTKVSSKILLMKISENNLFFICILPDYLCHEILEEFWKNSPFENIRADFLRRCQKSLRQNEAFSGMKN